MSKVKEFISKHDLIAAFLFLLMIASIISLNTMFYAGDEQWNFGNIYKMINGGTIYVDNNVIITPLFFFIGKMLLNVFGANFVVFRIYGLLIYSFLLFCIYLLLKQLKLKKTYSFLVTLYLYVTTMNITLSGANYNVMAVALVLLAIIVLNSDMKKSIKALVEGLLMFLIFFTKQNIGAFYIIGLVVYHLSELKGKDTNGKKDILKALFLELFVAAICLLIAIFGMYIKGNLIGFVNYCILGIREFNNNFSFGLILNMIYDLASIVLLIVLNLVADKVFKLNEEKKSEKKLVFIESIFILFIQYPIFNQYHIELSFVLQKIYIAILFVGLVEHYFNSDKLNKIMEKTCCFFVILGFVVSTIHFYFYIVEVKQSYINEKYKIYYGMKIEDQYVESINKVCDYIVKEKENGNNVIIISNKAMIYNMLLKINNGEFDLPFIGNFGIKGVDGIIEDIAALENSKIMIVKDEEDRIYQESDKIREYIINNLEYEEDMEEFMIYSTK